MKASNETQRPHPHPAPCSELLVTILVVPTTSLEVSRNCSGTSASMKCCDPFYFCKVSSNGSTFTLDFSHLSPLSFFFFLVSLAKVLSILLIFSENQLLVLLIFPYFLIPYFIYLHSDLYYFLPPAGFGVCLLLFF